MTLVLCALGAALAVAGDVSFKRWADHAAHPVLPLAVGLLLYSLDACVWAAILRRGIMLSLGAVAWSATGLVLAIAAGVLLYGERLSARQSVGALLVLLGMVLA